MACVCCGGSACAGSNYADDCPVHNDPCINPRRQDCCIFFDTPEDRFRFPPPYRYKCCPGTCIAGSHQHSSGCLTGLGLKDFCCPSQAYTDASRAPTVTISWKGRTATAGEGGTAELIFTEGGVFHRGYVQPAGTNNFGYWTTATGASLSGSFPRVSETERCPDSLSQLCQRRGRLIIAGYVSNLGVGGRVVNLLDEATSNESSVGITDIPSYSVAWRNNTSCANPLP